MEKVSGDEIEEEIPLASLVPVSAAAAFDALDVLFNFYQTNEMEKSFFEYYCKMKKMIDDFKQKKRFKAKYDWRLR